MSRQILFVSSNPTDTPRSASNKEVREIEEGLEAIQRAGPVQPG